MMRGSKLGCDLWSMISLEAEEAGLPSKAIIERFSAIACWKKNSQDSSTLLRADREPAGMSAAPRLTTRPPPARPGSKLGTESSEARAEATFTPRGGWAAFHHSD